MWLDIKVEGWLLILATVMGPILAVQAQKYLERHREKKRIRMWIFHTLMATRAARLTPVHIEALNSIDIVFYGERIFNSARRTAKEQAVLDAWHEYLSSLGDKVDEKDQSVLLARREELFTNLLAVLSAERGFSFDRVMLAKGAYFPQGHSDDDAELRAVRRMQLRVLAGDARLKMDVTSFPADPAAIARMQELQAGMTGAFGGGALKVEIQKPKE